MIVTSSGYLLSVIALENVFASLGKLSTELQHNNNEKRKLVISKHRNNNNS